MSLLELDNEVEPSLKRGGGRLSPDLGGAPVVVLKFGSSILRGPEDIPGVVSEIYKHVRRGEKVVAVVSAFVGQTDTLLAHARSLGADHDNGHLPRYVALGEEKSASLLAIGCDRVGLDCVSLSVPELGIVADGSPEDSNPLRLGGFALHEALARHEVVIAPGFGAVCENGRVVLLGRGGSDLTAVFIASELGLDRVRLVKDVDGVYESDPNAASGARRFPALDWATARQVAGKLVQPRAIDAAEAAGVLIEVAAIGREQASLVGPVGAAAVPAPLFRKQRVAIAGAGVVGAGVLARLLARSSDYEVVGVLVRDPSKPRGVELGDVLVTDDPDALFAAAPDVLVELLSDGAAGERLIRRALQGGVHVVSANKQAVARDLPGLEAAAAASGARLSYSAAVGGGSPMIETLRAARAAGEIVAIEAVLNGTVNFILDRLSRGIAFDQALDQARKAGFAEEDPSSDLEGLDAAAKLRILAHEAFGAAPPLDHVVRTALRADDVRAPEAWGALKQLAVCRKNRGGLASSVGLESVASEPLFKALRGERNALKVTLGDGRVFACKGRGAGRWPTAESVLADLSGLAGISSRNSASWDSSSNKLSLDGPIMAV